MSSLAVRRIYRELFRLTKYSKDMPLSDLQELRASFRKPLAAEETLEGRMKQAESRLSFIRMTTTKTRSRGDTGKWIYKNGERLENVNGTLRDGTGRVVSNWNGSNLDPQSVSTHRKQLKRMGFRNNAHAKGFF